MNDSSLAEKLRGRPVGLALSAGFFGFYHQAGVIEALVELGVRPKAVTGSSAGALAGSLYASGLPPREIRRALLRLERRDFWDMGWPFGPKGFGFLAGERFKGELGRALACHSFETCAVPLRVGVYDLAVGRMRYLSTGPLIPAVYASCALPYLFQPQVIDGRTYWDGGFFEKTPLVPFLSTPDIETVIVSYLPQRGSRERSGLSFLPAAVPLFADIPFEERLERDRASISCLRAANRRVIVIAPKPIKLGLSTLDRAEAAYENGRRGALAILTSTDESLLGAPHLESGPPAL